MLTTHWPEYEPERMSLDLLGPEELAEPQRKSSVKDQVGTKPREDIRYGVTGIHFLEKHHWHHDEMEMGIESGGCFNGLEKKTCFWDEAATYWEKKTGKHCTSRVEPEMDNWLQDMDGGVGRNRMWLRVFACSCQARGNSAVRGWGRGGQWVCL